MVWADILLGIINPFGGLVAAVLSQDIPSPPGVVSDITDVTAEAINASLTKIQDWFTEQLEDGKNWVIEQINALTEEIRVWKHKFRVELSKWLADPVLFWLTIGGIILATIYLPDIVGKILTSPQFATLVKVFKTIKEMAGDFLVKIHYTQLLEAAKILFIIKPEYADFWRDLDQAFMGFAEELEIGVGTMNTCTEAVRNLYYSTYSMLGLDADTIEMKFYQDATKFWAKANEDIEKYIRNPHIIFDAIQRELVYPVLNEQAKYGIERAKYDIQLAESVSTTIESVDGVRTSFNKLVDGLPEVVREAIDAHAGDFLDKANGLFTDKLLPFKDKVDSSIGVIQTDIDDMSQAIFENMQRNASKAKLVASALFDDNLNLDQTKKEISALLGKVINDSVSTSVDLETIILTATSETDTLGYVPPESAKPIPYSPLFTINTMEIKISVGGWFVGEY